MSKIGFIVDSASGIKNGQFPNVHVIPLVITVKDDSGNVKEYLDGVNVTEAEIAADIKKGYDVKTSQAAVGVLMQEIEKIQDQYDKIYVMPIQPKISSSYNTWMMIKDDYPKLVILPTTDFTCGCIWNIEHLIDLANKDQLTDEVAMDYIKNIHKKRNGILFVYDLNQLVKGGRISNFKA
ncbi:MAG: DegV family protein, partial [Malacoplasma sp.]|nr:DegV family protein [Malacoplasma sp.]